MSESKSGSSSSRLSVDEALYNHLVLPSQLPHREDDNTPEIENELVQRLVDSARHMRDLPKNELRATWDTIYRCLQVTKNVNAGGRLDRSVLVRELRLLGRKEFLVVHVRAQNCALFIRRSQDSVLGSAVIFEAFEASPRNEDVLATDNALRWNFPGSAVAVSLSTFLEDGFINNLSTFLEHASRESIKDFAAHTFKAGATIFEYRNTPEPSLVTSMLMAILQQNGRRFAPTLLQKRVRDDVCWKNADKPWRRLSYWLILRVSIARFLATELGGGVGRVEYKFMVAHLLSTFLSSMQAASMSVQQLDVLKKKICRRIVKLDADKEHTQDSSTATRLDYLFLHLEPYLRKSVNQASAMVNALWSKQKLLMKQSIPRLPRQASPEDLRIDLRVSRNFLQNVLTGFTRPRRRASDQNGSVNIAIAAKKHLNSFARRHFDLVDLEIESSHFCAEPTHSVMTGELFASAAELIDRHLHAVRALPGNVPEVKSEVILNIMEIWTKIDKAACNLYPLLKEYHPLFHHEMLDVLLISQHQDMKRLVDIQTYLEDRVAACEGSKISIFDDPHVRGCFGQRAYDEFPESTKMKSLHDEIEEWAKGERLVKEEDWKEKTEQYSTLSKRIDQSSCVYVVDEENPLGRGRHDPHCHRCRMVKQLGAIRIQVYEHPLPSDDVVAKAVIFELECPAVFALYRDTTWQILCQLAFPWQEESMKPKCLIRNYSQLRNFANRTVSSFSLASTTKSFLTTHYSSMSFPVEWDSGRDGVCRPNGLKLSSYDSRSNLWAGRRRSRPTFEHHVKLDIPKSSPFAKLLQQAPFSENTYGPSSYEIMSTASTCPSGINVHEYLAFQTIASGKARRWFSILTELASANLNFSNDVTMLLLRHLSLQSGPLGDGKDSFRLIHAAFRNEGFCDKLIQQLSQRLDSLSANWRETCLMETIISLGLRLFDLAVAGNLVRISESAFSLLLRAREVCVRWFKLLRIETYKTTDTEMAQRYQQYALWAGLLCKQTFATHSHHSQELDKSSLEIFIQSSIIVQDNLVVKIESLPSLLQHAVVRDMRMSYKLRHVVSAAILARPDVFAISLREVWPEEEGCSRTLSNLVLEKDCWVSCRAAAGPEACEQAVYYNFAEGFLLVDGLPIGKLPKDPKKSLIVNELFGNQALLTYPSAKNGMQYVLCVRPQGYQVHIGFGQDGDIIIRAVSRGRTLQLIHRELFRSGGSWDLPGPLLEGCFHWLNLNNGDVYITKKEHPWPKAKFSGYVLNVHEERCTRTRVYNGKVTQDNVVNTYSQLFDRAARILESFENRACVLVTQPGGGRYVQVELPRVNILFHVNDKYLLQSPQLRCEIDPDQDAGTWYGLRSKLVCRSIDNPTNRKVLVPMGELVAEAHGCHVSVRIKPSGVYARYTINDILGRLDCAAEPLLVYTKALLHAYTSFIIPDPLTGHTGTEEAIKWLQSGICQPWEPLGHGPMECLKRIAQLTPGREYYPKDLKVMRTDIWNVPLPANIQNSHFRPLVDRILQTSDEIARFASSKCLTPELPSAGELHLHRRAIIRQEALERCLDSASDKLKPKNKPYQPRDCPSPNNIRYRNVLEISRLLNTWPKNFSTTPYLAQVLASGNTIGGFGTLFSQVSLDDRLKVDVVSNWGSLVEFCRQTSNRYDLMFLLGLMSFRLDANMSLMRTLAAFSIFKELQTVELPPWDEYCHFTPNQAPHLDYLLQLLKPFGTPFPDDVETALGGFSSAKQRKKMHLERSKHDMQVEEDKKFFANFLLDQWPCIEPSASGLSRSVSLDIGMALGAIRPEWKRLYQNRDLEKHIQEVQATLDRRTSEEGFDAETRVMTEETFPTRMRNTETVDLRQLFLKPFSPENEATNLQRANVGVIRAGKPPASTSGVIPRWSQSGNHKGEAKVSPVSHEIMRATLQLGEMTQALGTCPSLVRQRYADDLRDSLAAFRHPSPPTTMPRAALASRGNAIEYGIAKTNNTFRSLEAALDAAAPGFSQRRIEWLKSGGLWPIVSKRTVLEQLRSIGTQHLFGTGMHKTLVTLGVEITQLQREIRLHELALKKDSGRYQEEEANEGHSNWKPSERPDWLLLEIESNMMIRPIQIDVAEATMSPRSGSNSVLQMNMGQGKTSCIIPMVAVALADKKQLVRILVPKALLQQTAQLLQARLGGMLGRQLRHVPFFRRTPTTEENIRAYHSIHKDMLKSAGVMLCQPEHNMSFMLSGRQRLLDGKIVEADLMIKLQSWLSKFARDILDESDYTLAVRTQLIYPSGSQMTVDGHPHRWQVAEAVLRLVDEHMFQLPFYFPHSLSVIARPGGGFPLMYFLRHDVEDELIRKVTADICKGLGGILPMNANSLPITDRVAIKEFLTSTKPRDSTIEKIRKISPDRPSVRQTIYLLRGLLVNRILMMTLKKRWNVEYGLHPQRDPIAVPFHAKGVPSEQSEWGHPDVAILFTCLAFYYDGLNLIQLKQCLEHILKSDDPAVEYDKWAQSAERFPPSLRAWNSLNVDDEMQLSEIWNAVRFNRVVIDYFLNNFVFPRHAKQFKVKLQSNGWDIPLFPLGDNASNGKKATTQSLTTGFSGTNDNRTMLPLNIKQQDLPSLLHTSAEVLTYLLHSRSRRCVLLSSLSRVPGGRPSEKDLLFGLKQEKIRVLIDAGAQILEMDNLTLAEQWLRIEGTALAALYFDQGNKPWIVTRQGRKTPLLASPFADDLSQCLVYLDEAHTRGTDLRLPPNSRGALTLRLGQTKDHTVQAAMRLRQLGSTQAVTFFVPPEVHQSIADLQRKTMHETIDSADVIKWLLDNTCEAMEQLQPLYFSQGMDFCRRIQAELDNPDFLKNKSQREAFVETIKQEEQQTLQQLYEPKRKSRPVGLQTSTNDQLKGFIRELNNRRKTFQDTGRAVHGSALQEVEQEREVAFEVESVRQVKKPYQYPAYSFPGLHPSLESFARTGRIPADAQYFCHVFYSLSKTAIGRKFKVCRGASESKLFVTAEFDRTVKLNIDLAMDNFLRPVNWILWHPATETAIVIIPEEAEALIPMLRNPAIAMETHLLIYSAPITRKMLHFGDMNFYSIPPLASDWVAPMWLRVELGVFSGRLYFDWSEYEPLCTFLGIEEGAVTEDELGELATMDGISEAEHVYQPAETQVPNEGIKRLTDKPLTFIQEWLDVRRRGQDFVHSPMGFVSQGKLLQENHAFFNQATGDLGEPDLPIAPARYQPREEADDDDDDYHGVDDMGANEGVEVDIGDDHFVYDDVPSNSVGGGGFESDSA